VERADERLPGGLGQSIFSPAATCFAMSAIGLKRGGADEALAGVANSIAASRKK
jgi:hypothetical protein